MAMKESNEDIDISEPTFRVSVCLSRIFSDERSLCYVSVQARQPVRWLRRRLRRLFGRAVPRRLCLRSRGHLLPPDEPLSLLRPDDPVEVIPLPVTCDWARGDQFCRKSSEVVVSEPDNDPNLIRENMDLQEETHKDNRNNKIHADITENSHNIIQRDDDAVDGTHDDAQMPLDSELLKVKEHALALLQTCEIKSQNIMNTVHPGGTKRVRRRVRRRRPRPVDIACTNSEAPSPNTSDHYNPTSQSESSVILSAQLSLSEPAVPVTPVACDSLVSQPLYLFPDHTTAAPIVRNDAVAPRKARLVRMLDTEVEVHNKEPELFSQELSARNLEY